MLTRYPGARGGRSSRRALRRNWLANAIGIRYISIVHHHPSHSFIVPYWLFIVRKKVCACSARAPVGSFSLYCNRDLYLVLVNRTL